MRQAVACHWRLDRQLGLCLTNNSPTDEEEAIGGCGPVSILIDAKGKTFTNKSSNSHPGCHPLFKRLAEQCCLAHDDLGHAQRHAAQAPAALEALASIASPLSARSSSCKSACGCGMPARHEPQPTIWDLTLDSLQFNLKTVGEEILHVFQGCTGATGSFGGVDGIPGAVYRGSRKARLDSVRRAILARQTVRLLGHLSHNTYGVSPHVMSSCLPVP